MNTEWEYLSTQIIFFRRMDQPPFLEHQPTFAPRPRSAHLHSIPHLPTFARASPAMADPDMDEDLFADLQVTTSFRRMHPDSS
jgi:hypothetical protein